MAESRLWEEFDKAAARSKSTGSESPLWDRFDKENPQRGIAAEVGTQLYAGATVDLPKMVGQAMQWFGEEGGDLAASGKSVVDWAERRARENPEFAPQTAGSGLVRQALSGGARAIVPSLASAVPALAAAPLGVPAALAAGGAGIVGLFGGSQAQDTYEEVKKAGGSEEDAKTAGYINMLIESGGEAIGTYAGAKLLGLLAKPVMKAGESGVQAAIRSATSTEVLAPWLKQLPKTALIESATEFGQGAGEAAVERAYGVQGKDPMAEGVHGALAAIGMTALLAPFGLATRNVRALSNERVANALTDPETDLPKRIKASNLVFNEIAKVNPEAAKAWSQNAAVAISEQLPISLEEPAPDVSRETPLAGQAAPARPLDSVVSDIVAAPSPEQAIGAAMQSVDDDLARLVGAGMQDALSQGEAPGLFARARQVQAVDQWNAEQDAALAGPPLPPAPGGPRTIEERLAIARMGAEAAVAEAAKARELDKLQRSGQPAMQDAALDAELAKAQAAAATAPVEAPKTAMQIAMEQARAKAAPVAGAPEAVTTAQAAPQAGPQPLADAQIVDALNRLVSRRLLTETERDALVGMGYAKIGGDNAVTMTKAGFSARQRIMRAMQPASVSPVSPVPASPNQESVAAPAAAPQRQAPDVTVIRAGDGWRVAGARNLNPISQTYLTQQEADAAAEEFKLTGNMPAPEPAPVAPSPTAAPAPAANAEPQQAAPADAPPIPDFKRSTDKALRLAAKTGTPAVKAAAEAEIERRAQEKAEKASDRAAAASARMKERARLDVERDSLLRAIAKLGGLKAADRLDLIGDEKGNRLVPGVGPLFRTNGGKGLDELASRLHELGYLTDEEINDVDGGVDFLRMKIRDEWDGVQTHLTPAGMGYAAAMDEKAREEARAEMEAAPVEGQGKADVDAAQMAAAEAVEAALIHGLNIELADSVRAAYDEEEAGYNAVASIQETLEREYDEQLEADRAAAGIQPRDDGGAQRAAAGASQGGAERRAQGGIEGDRGGVPEAGQPEEVADRPALELAAQTPEEARAEAERLAEIARKEAADRAAAAAKERREANKAEKDRRAAQVIAEREAAKKAEVDAAAANFALGQQAPAPVDRKVDDAAAAGQRDVFGDAPEPVAPAAPANPIAAAADALIQAAEAMKAAVENPEARNASPEAESQAPAPSEPGDRGVAPARDGVAPDADARNESATGKIADFGEKIGGARKDVWAAFKDKMREAVGMDVAAEPLSKSWPVPDYQALLDSGADPWGVAFMHAARDEVPAKPKAPWKLKGWVTQVTALRDTALKLADGTLSTDRAKERLAEMAETSRGMSDIAGRIELYQLVGHGKSLSGVRISSGTYSIYEGKEYNPPKVIWAVEKQAAATAFSNWPRMLATGSTKAEALQNFKEKYDSLAISGPASKEATFDIFSKRAEDGYWIGKKIGRNPILLEGPFKTVREARIYKVEHNAEIAAKLEKAKAIPNERRETNEPRVGVDMRNAQDVTPQMFADAFGFKGVEFGNWVEQGKRQADLNDAYDALMDMAAILGVPPKALSLNGELGLAFGARGSGGINPASAHYEPGKVVINLTKKRGAGSLGHEWWHALDNYFSRMRERGSDYLTEGQDVSLSSRGSAYQHKGAVRKEMVDAFGAVVRAIRETALKERAAKLDAKRSKDYWTTGREMSARAFESYLISKLQDQSAANDYLANIVSEDTWKAAESLGFELEGSYPYPTAGEVPKIRAAFDRFFQTVEMRETERGVAMFSRPTYTAGSDDRPTPFAAAADALRMLSRADGLFQQSRSAATAMEQIAADIDPGMKVADNTAQLAEAGLGPNIVRLWAVTMPDGSQASVNESTDGTVVVDASMLKSGQSRGSALYGMLFTYAHNNGKVFIGDPISITEDAVLRRTEQMVSSALKFGTTRHMAPHPDQGIEWADGDDAGNMARLLQKSYENVAKAAPQIEGIRYNFDSRRFEEVGDGKPVTQADFAALAQSGGARAARAGSATLRRAALIGSLLRGEGGQGSAGDGGRDAVLAQVVRQLREGVDPSLKDTFYRRSDQGPADAGLSVSALRTFVEVISAAWQSAPRVTVLDRPEDSGLAGVDPTAWGMYHGGQVYLFASNIPTLADAQFVLLHEIMGHAGLRGLLGDEIGPVLKELASVNPALRVEAAAWMARYGKQEIADRMERHGMSRSEAEADVRLAAIEEALSDRAGKGLKITGFQRFVAAIQRLLRKAGLDAVADWMEGATQAETAALLASAREFVEGDPSPFTAAQAARFGLASRGPEMRAKAMEGMPLFGRRTDQTSTAAFRAWFGASKVVDADGKPLVVYHGTTADFWVFDPALAGSATGHPTARLGFWFTASQDVARNFTSAIDDSVWPVKLVQQPGAKVMQVYLSIKNPYIVSVKQFREINARPYGKEFEAEQPLAAKRTHEWIAQNRQRLIDKGYDGILVKGDPKYADDLSGQEYSADAWVAFRPEQIKSAIGNRGTFDPTNPDIRYSRPTREQGIPPSAGDIVSGYRNTLRLKAHPDYAAGKSGDVDGAVRLVRDLAGGLVEKLRDRVGPGAIFVAPAAPEASGDNVIPDVLARLLSIELNGTVDDKIVQANSAAHTGANAMERMVSRPLFDGAVTPGARYVLVDDVVTLGGTMAELADHVVAAGGHVDAVAILVDASRPATMRPSAKVIAEIERRYGDAIRETLHVEPAALTAAEAGYLIGFRDAASFRARAAAAVEENYRRASAREVSQDVEPPRYSRGPSVVAQAGEIAQDILRSDAKFNLWHRTVGTGQHKAKLNSEYRAVYDEVQGFIADTSRYANEAADLAQDLLPRIESLADFKRKAPSKDDIRAVASALMEGTLYGGGSPMDGKVWTDDELRGVEQFGRPLPTAFKLTDEQIKLYRQARAAVDKSLDEVGKALLWRLARTHGMDVDRDMSLEDIAEYARMRMREMAEERRANAEMADEAHEEELANYTESLDDGRPQSEVRRLIQKFKDDHRRYVAGETRAAEEMEAAVKAVDDIEGKVNGLKEHGYYPAMRFGRYYVRVDEKQPGMPAEQVYFGMYESQFAANRAARQLAKDYPGALVSRGIVAQDTYKLYQGLSLDAVETFAEHMTDEEGRPLRENTVVQQFLRAAVNERSILKRHIHRKGIEGYSTDVPRTLSSFVLTSSRSAAGHYHLGEAAKLAAGIKDGDVQKEAADLVTYIKNPQEEAAAVRGLLFATFLGGSIASAITNLTQPLMVTAPWMTQHTSYADAAAKIAAAVRDYWRRGSLSGELGEAFKRAEREGIVSPQEIHQLRAEAEGSAVSSSLAWRKVTHAWGFFFQQAEQLNRGATFIAAYRLAQQNKSLGDPYAFARTAVEETQFVYNKGSRPRFGRGPIGATVMTFKTFSISYLELAKRLYDLRNPDGSRSLKPFAIMLLTLFVMAGLEGLPFAEDAEDLIDTIGQWLGYGTNSKKKLRQLAASAIGPDAAQILLHGVSGIPGVPLDVSGRLGMHNLIPGTAALKPSEKNKARDVLEILGPAGQFLPVEGAKVGEALKAAAKGDFFGQRSAMSELSPVAVQNLLTGIEMASTGQYKDREGRLVRNVTAGDAAVKAIGFNPRSVADESRLIREQRQDVEIVRQREDAIADRWARGILEQQPAEVQAAREELFRWNQDNPDMPIKITMSQIASRVKQARMTRADRFTRSAPPEMRRSVRDGMLTQ